MSQLVLVHPFKVGLNVSIYGKSALLDFKVVRVTWAPTFQICYNLN